MPNIWSVTRFSGKSILIAATCEQDARKKYDRMASQVPELGLQQDHVVSVRRVAYIK